MAAVTIADFPGNSRSETFWLPTWTAGDTVEAIREKVAAHLLAKKADTVKNILKQAAVQIAAKDAGTSTKSQSFRWKCGRCGRGFQQWQNARRHFWCLKDGKSPAKKA
jgi:hypothetical protein